MAEPQDRWREFVSNTRPDTDEDASFRAMADALSGSGQRWFRRLRAVTHLSWYGPAAFFIAGMVLAALPSPRSINGSSFWHTGRQPLGQLLEGRIAVPSLLLLSVTLFIAHMCLALRHEPVPETVRQAERILATAMLILTALIWGLLITFWAANTARVLIPTLLVCTLIGFGLVQVGRRV